MSSAKYINTVIGPKQLIGGARLVASKVQRQRGIVDLDVSLTVPGGTRERTNGERARQQDPGGPPRA